MPIWFELVALSLAAYSIGLGIGWIVWGRGDAAGSEAPQSPDTNGETQAS